MTTLPAIGLTLLLCSLALVGGCKALHKLCREDRFSRRSARNNAEF